MLSADIREFRGPKRFGDAPEGAPERLSEVSPNPTDERVPVGGIAFDNVTMAEAVARIILYVQKADHPCHICTGNLDHLVMLHKDPEFRAIYNEADLVLADGMPVLWLSRLNRHIPSLQERVAGSDLLWELGRVSAMNGLRLFFLGGAPGSAELAAEAVCARYPGAQICGRYCPPFESFGSDTEQKRIEEIVRAAAPDILLVGLGAPKQEKWIAAHKHRLGIPVSIGVGGSFEMAAGIFRRAPVWAQRSGLEWVYRLIQDPGRLWRRYLCSDLPFFARLLWQTILTRTTSTETSPSHREAPTPNRTNPNPERGTSSR